MKKQTVEPKKTASKRKSSKAKKLACVDLFRALRCVVQLTRLKNVKSKYQ